MSLDLAPGAVTAGVLAPPRPAARSQVFLELLAGLRGVRDGGDRAVVDQYEHALQCATRARRDGADDELVVVALLHDVFRLIAPATHGEALAMAIGDRLSRDRMRLLWNHGVWQHDVVHGTDRAARYAALSWFADAQRFGAWDAASFDPGYDTLPLEVFAPAVAGLLD